MKKQTDMFGKRFCLYDRVFFSEGRRGLRLSADDTFNLRTALQPFADPTRPVTYPDPFENWEIRKIFDMNVHQLRLSSEVVKKLAVYLRELSPTDPAVRLLKGV